MVEPRAAVIDRSDVIDFGRGNLFTAVQAVHAERVAG